METITEIIKCLNDLDTTINGQENIIDRYRLALREIQQIGIHNSDSVEAATQMEQVANRALNGR